MSPLPPYDAREYLKNLPGWELADGKIKKQFTSKDFKEAMHFVNQVAQVAESEGHHPDILVSYNKVTYTLWTHAVGGLSLNDFILAAKIEELYN